MYLCWRDWKILNGRERKSTKRQSGMVDVWKVRMALEALMPLSFLPRCSRDIPKMVHCLDFTCPGML